MLCLLPAAAALPLAAGHHMLHGSASSTWPGPTCWSHAALWSASPQLLVAAACAETRWLCSRTIPCPKGTDTPACETVLLHREDFKIPEKMARFAVRHGMAGFVKKMGAGVHPFVESRRERVDKVG